MDLQDWKSVPHLHPLQRKVECSLLFSFIALVTCTLHMYTVHVVTHAFYNQSKSCMPVFFFTWQIPLLQGKLTISHCSFLSHQIQYVYCLTLALQSKHPCSGHLYSILSVLPLCTFKVSTHNGTSPCNYSLQQVAGTSRIVWTGHFCCKI